VDELAEMELQIEASWGNAQTAAPSTTPRAMKRREAPLRMTILLFINCLQ
jgi:hypothetical protein